MRYTAMMCLISMVLYSCSTTNKFVSETKGSYQVTVPKTKWVMSFPEGGFDVENENLKPDGKTGYYYFTDGPSDIDVSFYIEPATDCSDAMSCRDYALNNKAMMFAKAKDLQLTEFGDWAMIEFFVPEFQEKEINQQHMYAHYVKEGFWINVHLSKVNYKKTDRKLFLDFVKSISFNKKIVKENIN